MCTLTIEYHPTAYAPGEARDDMSVPMDAIRRQAAVGKVGCSGKCNEGTAPTFCKKDTTRTFQTQERM